LFTGVVVTGDKFIAGIVVTGEKFIAVSMTPAITENP
jgi:hypothetical protein